MNRLVQFGLGAVVGFGGFMLLDYCLQDPFPSEEDALQTSFQTRVRKLDSWKEQLLRVMEYTGGTLESMDARMPGFKKAFEEAASSEEFSKWFGPVSREALRAEAEANAARRRGDTA